MSPVLIPIPTVTPPGYVWLSLDRGRLHLVPATTDRHRVSLCGVMPWPRKWAWGSEPPCPDCMSRVLRPSPDALECAQCDEPVTGAGIRVSLVCRIDDPGQPVVCSAACLDAWAEAQWEADTGALEGWPI